MNIIAWLHNNNPQLLEELLLIDRVLDGALLKEPDHTLSYNIAVAARDGNWKAKMLCHLLNLLSPNHCPAAIANESTQQWTEATEEVG